MKISGNYLLGKGPVFDIRTRTLYFVDIQRRKLLVKKDGDEPRSFDFDEFVTSVHLTDDSHYVLVTTRASLFVVDVEIGKREHIITLDIPENMRFNDGTVAPDGTLYMGTMKIDPPRSDEGRLFRITADGCSSFDDAYGVPNGMKFLDATQTSRELRR